MTEFEKMRNEEFYDFTSEECLASYFRAKHICAKLQTMTVEDDDYRETIEALIPGIPESSTVAPPFHCDHGHGIKLGENVFINYNGTMLDGGLITIGSNTQIGPNCQFLTPNHPIDYMERRKPIERCSPITIGEDCWLGGGVTVCPGVTIGDRCIIGAGSVVVKDIPSDSIAVGNPCKVIKSIEGSHTNGIYLHDECTSRVFGISIDQLKSKTIATLLKNQGVYNGLISVLLLIAVWQQDLLGDNL